MIDAETLARYKRWAEGEAAAVVDVLQNRRILALIAEVERLREERDEAFRATLRAKDERGEYFEQAYALQAQVDAVKALADRLAASVILLAHDAHPTYGSTAGWHGGIGGQTMTTGCSIKDPPPDAHWTQYDLPTSVAREWINSRDGFDLDSIKAQLKTEWLAALGETGDESHG